MTLNRYGFDRIDHAGIQFGHFSHAKSLAVAALALAKPFILSPAQATILLALSDLPNASSAV